MANKSQAYMKAKKRVEAKLGFYIHAAIFALVNLILMIVDLSTSPDKIWFIWPLLGWGGGLLLHGLLVFFYPNTGSFKDDMIRKEMEQDKS